MRAIVVSALLCTIAAPALAQDAAEPVIYVGGERLNAPPIDQAPSNVASVRVIYDFVKDHVTRSVDKMSEENYGYQPTEEVRTYAGILGHIADGNYLFCSAAKGEESPSTGELENLTTKAELAQALAESFTYCDEAYAMSDEQAGETVELFGQTLTRLGVLAFNAAHDNEHYGNLVTYMRINGIVPPSSEGM